MIIRYLLSFALNLAFIPSYADSLESLRNFATSCQKITYTEIVYRRSSPEKSEISHDLIENANATTAQVLVHRISKDTFLTHRVSEEANVIFQRFILKTENHIIHGFKFHPMENLDNSSPWHIFENDFEDYDHDPARLDYMIKFFGNPNSQNQEAIYNQSGKVSALTFELGHYEMSSTFQWDTSENLETLTAVKSRGDVIIEVSEVSNIKTTSDGDCELSLDFIGVDEGLLFTNQSGESEKMTHKKLISYLPD